MSTKFEILSTPKIRLTLEGEDAANVLRILAVIGRTNSYQRTQPAFHEELLRLWRELDEDSFSGGLVKARIWVQEAGVDLESSVRAASGEVKQ